MKATGNLLEYLIMPGCDYQVRKLSAGTQPMLQHINWSSQFVEEAQRVLTGQSSFYMPAIKLTDIPTQDKALVIPRLLLQLNPDRAVYKKLISSPLPLGFHSDRKEGFGIRAMDYRLSEIDKRIISGGDLHFMDMESNRISSTVNTRKGDVAIFNEGLVYHGTTPMTYQLGSQTVELRPLLTTDADAAPGEKRGVFSFKELLLADQLKQAKIVRNLWNYYSLLPGHQLDSSYMPVKN